MFYTIKRIINWCGDFKGKLYIGFVFSFFSYWFAAAPIALSALCLGKLVLTQQQGEVFDSRLIWISALLILVSILLRFGFDYLRARFQETISYELIARDRLAIGDALKRVSLGYFQEVNTGSILSSLTTGLTTLENMGIRMMDTFVGGYLNFIAILLGLFVLSPRTVIIALAAMLGSFVSLMAISKKSKIGAPIEAQANRELTSASLEFARGLPVIKSFLNEGASTAAINKAIEKSTQVYLGVEWAYIPGNCAHLLFLKCGCVGIALASFLSALAGDISFIVMLMLILFSFTVFASLEPMSDSTHVLGVIDNAMNQIDALKVKRIIDEDGKDIPLSSFNIEYNNVEFGYDERNVINDISLTIPEKTSTAIIGPSGCGKTTLINLLARFYDVQKGSITIGGHDVREFTCDSLLSNMSMVFQQVYLFNDTIRNNICFGRPETTEEEMIEAAKKARCHDFIMDLPLGYDTIVGEGGGRLSGGEKQRISIARAILKDAPIVILDEATASIDPENEHLIQSALTKLTEGKTVITIAHRLATIEQADQIFVIDKGVLVQQGKHEDLLLQDGLYRRFIETRNKAEGWTISQAK